MKISTIFKGKETKHPWQKWPSCKHPKTLSFRAGDEVIKTVNSVFFDPSEGLETPESWFTDSSETTSFSTESEDYDGESLEVVVRGARSERLFFEPGDTNSILEKAKTGGFPFKESVELAMESENPYVDFRRSMEEMVESHGLKDWDCLKELLGWYLKVNGKKNHGYIVGAFVDLLVGIAAAPCSDSTFSSSSPLCSLKVHDEIDEEEQMGRCDQPNELDASPDTSPQNAPELKALNKEEGEEMANPKRNPAKEKEEYQRVGSDGTKDDLRGRTRLADKMNGQASPTSFPAKEKSKWPRVGTDDDQDSPRGWTRCKEVGNDMSPGKHAGREETAPFQDNTAGKDDQDLHQD